MIRKSTTEANSPVSFHYYWRRRGQDIKCSRRAPVKSNTAAKIDEKKKYVYVCFMYYFEEWYSLLITRLYSPNLFPLHKTLYAYAQPPWPLALVQVLTTLLCQGHQTLQQIMVLVFWRKQSCKTGSNWCFSLLYPLPFIVSKPGPSFLKAHWVLIT